MNNNRLSSKENPAMRKRYGSWGMKLLAVLTLLLGVSAANAQLINPKFYPTLSVKNYRFYPDGRILVPAPSPGGDRYFLVPVFIWNEVDPAFNPNVGGQTLEPIRSFQFQLSYLTQAMVLDTQASHGPAVTTIGPSLDSTEALALARSFYIRYHDFADPGVTNNPFRRTVRITGASEVPLDLALLSDTSKVLVYVRFKVVQSNVNAGLINLDSSTFNDHPGDPMANPLTWQRGNFGGDPTNKGQGIVAITAQPGFDFRPFSQVSTDDNLNYTLTTDLVYDPTVTGAPNPQVGIQIRDAIGNTRLTNVSICTNQPWLFVKIGNPGGGKQCEFVPRIDYTSSFGSEEKQLWISADPAVSNLRPGIYEGMISFVSDGAFNSPALMKVRLIVRANPVEPGPGPGTGIRLTLTNSCSVPCTSTLSFGTGAGASAGIDPLYGETIFDQSRREAQDTNVVGSQRCWAYFEPVDKNADEQYQNPTFLGTDRDVRSDKTDTTILYKVVFSAGGPECYPMTVCVDPRDFPAGARVIARDVLNGSIFSVDLRNATQNGDLRCFVIRDTRINSFYIEYTPGTIGTVPAFVQNGWNLISLPVIPPDDRASVIFPNAAGTPFRYRANEGWTPVTTLEFGRGYMIKYGTFTGNDNIVAGIRTNQVRNVRVDKEWNTVGAASKDACVAGIFFTPIPGNTSVPELQTDVFEYVTSRGYRSVGYLNPGKGYFVKTSAEGFYNLDAYDCKSGASAAQVLEGSLGRVTISDAAKNGQELFFGTTSMGASSSRFELPPAVATLDARFASNKGYIEFNQDSYVVNVSNAKYPVSMSFSNIVGEVEVRDMNGNVLGTASNGAAVTIADKTVKQVHIAFKGNGSAAPLGFSLEQNFPNPFNPSTSIFYTVPSETFVSLKVYNQLGQEVKTLVNEIMPTGRHEVKVDASDLVSGTYYYTLHAGSFTQTAKMTLSK